MRLEIGDRLAVTRDHYGFAALDLIEQFSEAALSL